MERFGNSAPIEPRGKLPNPCLGILTAKKQKTKVVVYNPLDKLNLAKSIELELLGRPANSLASIKDISSAGVYAIYYTGPFTAYAPLAEANASRNFSKPIYVGKAIPKGGRKGGLAKDVASTGKALLDRLKQHASSISEAENLELEHFFVRHLVVDDIWIPLGENMLIETFQPVWNRVIDGFGNKDPGQRRATQYNRHGTFCTRAGDSQRNYRQEQYFADRRREPWPGNSMLQQS